LARIEQIADIARHRRDRKTLPLITLISLIYQELNYEPREPVACRHRNKEWTDEGEASSRRFIPDTGG